MKNDFLKEFIDTHRGDFENPLPELNGLPKVLEAMHLRQSARSGKLILAGIAAATTVILAISLYLTSSQQTETVLPPDPIASQHLQSKAATPDLEMEKAMAVAPPITERKHARKALRQPVAAAKPDIYHDIRKVLKYSTSTAEKIEAIQMAGSMSALHENVKMLLCNTFETDESPIVRMAALTILGRNINDTLIRNRLSAALITQTDPAIQLGLINLVNTDPHPLVTQHLREIASNPFTIGIVKDEANYALLTRNN
ncbi:MAG: hypothetical protein M9898_14870 [Chitinophagaceae bacterium]|nr:hypothetical protein [Chitinophagaceae bacterium]MCW5914504.1 hypothetical protein [Chitinophagaceae bacterium]